MSCIFLGPDYVVTIRHAESPDLARFVAGWRISARLSCGSDPRRSFTPSWTRSSTSTPPSLRGLENDIDEIEDQLFKEDPAASPPHLRPHS